MCIPAKPISSTTSTTTVAAMATTPEPPPTTAKAPVPWKTSFFLSLASFINDMSRRPDLTVNRRLTSLLDPAAAPHPTKPRGGVLSLDVPLGPFSARVYLPQNSASAAPAAQNLPVLVFFHGGGFAFLSAASAPYDSACRRFARSIPAAVISVGYRLSPEHRYPSQYEDGVSVLRLLASGDTRLGPVLQCADLSAVFLAGDSAGANIAHHVARLWASAAEGGENSKQGLIRVRGVVAIQPFFGGEGRVESELRLKRAPLVNVERTDWLWRAFLPEGESRDHPAANVFGPRAAEMPLPEGFPPAVMVVVGGFDPLQDWQRKYVEGLRERGVEVTLVEYPNAIHAFYLFPELPEAKPLVEEVRAFVQKCTKL